MVAVCGDVFCQILERRVCVAHCYRHPDCAEHFRVVVAVTDGDHFSGRHAEQLAQPSQRTTLVRTGGQLVAFCYGSKISAEVLGTHVEKAWHDVNGAYPIINREYARAFGGAYRYINREEDLGEEGLRKAKLSYNPAILEKKFCAVLRSGG